MIETYRIDVQKFLNGKANNIYSRSIELDNSLVFPYSKVIEVLRLLYGNDVNIVVNQILTI